MDLFTMISMSAEPFVSKIIEVFVEPKLKALDRSISKRVDYLHQVYIKGFDNYLKFSYSTNSVISTLVYRDRIKALRDIYVPLTLISDRHNLDKKSEYIISKSTDYKSIYGYKKIKIVDTAGMGKSILLKKMFVDCIKDGTGVPFIIELRNLNSQHSIVDEIQYQLSDLSKDIKEEIVFQLLEQGEFIFFFDGYDEIAHIDKPIVGKFIRNFIDKTNDKNVFVLSSRREDGLSSFPDFKSFHIKKLNRNESYNIIKNYSINTQISEGLIDLLENESRLADLKDFLQVPLLVTLLYTAYEFKQKIPFKKHLFYRQVYDAYFEKHDITKGDQFERLKRSGLQVDTFHKILRYIGFYSFVKNDSILYSRDELLKLVDDAAKKYPDMDFISSRFIEDIITTVPIFSKDGLNFKWAHKSFQEYFFTQYVYHDYELNKIQLIGKMASNELILKYENILNIYAGTDFRTFFGGVIEKFIQRYSVFNNRVIEKFPNLYERNKIKYVISSFYKARHLISFFSESDFAKYLNLGEIGFDRFNEKAFLADFYYEIHEHQIESLILKPIQIEGGGWAVVVAAPIAETYIYSLIEDNFSVIEKIAINDFNEYRLSISAGAFGEKNETIFEPLTIEHWIFSMGGVDLGDFIMFLEYYSFCRDYLQGGLYYMDFDSLLELKRKYDSITSDDNIIDLL